MTSFPVPPRRSRVKARVTRQHATRRKTTAANAPGGREAATTPALFADLGPTMTAQVDTATLLRARFHRVVLRTNGQLLAEFLPQDLELPRIFLDEAEIYAADIFAPTRNTEFTIALEAIERTRRRVDRR